MAIARPITKTVISTAAWGIPITDAVNANTAQLLGALPIMGVYQKKTAAANTGTALGNRDVNVVTITPFTVPVTMFAIMRVSIGGPGTPSWTPVITKLVDGTSTPAEGAYQSTVANAYIDCTMTGSWSVPANGDPSFKGVVNVTVNPGTLAIWAIGSAIAIAVKA